MNLFKKTEKQEGLSGLLDDRHILLRWILGLLILFFVFTFGYKLGSLNERVAKGGLYGNDRGMMMRPMMQMHSKGMGMDTMKKGYDVQDQQQQQYPQGGAVPTTPTQPSQGQGGMQVPITTPSQPSMQGQVQGQIAPAGQAPLYQR